MEKKEEEEKISAGCFSCTGSFFLGGRNSKNIPRPDRLGKEEWLAQFDV